MLQIVRQAGVVKIHDLFAESQPEHSGALAAPLHRALVIGSRIGEAAVVEDVVGIEGSGFGVDAIEGSVFDFVWGDGAEARDAPETIVSIVSHVNEVTAQLRTVETQAELRAAARLCGVADVEGVAHENPAPAEIRSNLHVCLRSGGDGLVLTVGGASGEFVELEDVRVLHHRREVIVVRRDIGCVVFVKTSNETCQPTLFQFFRDGDFLRLLGGRVWREEEAKAVGGEAVGLFGLRMRGRAAEEHREKCSEEETKNVQMIHEK